MKDISEVIGNFISAVVVVCTVVLIFSLDIVYSAYCGKTIWNWFIPGIFPKMPALTVWTAAALAIVASYFTKNKNVNLKEMANQFKEGEEKPFTSILALFVRPTLFLVIGWAVHTLGPF